MKSNLEQDFLFHARVFKLPNPEREVLFNPYRKWRFDFAWPNQMVAAEIEGGTWSGGRHTSGKGFEGDCEKYNSATLLGWKVFRFTGKHVKSGEAVQVILMALENGERK
jgi:very-short-patch-repair endonuclease